MKEQSVHMIGIGGIGMSGLALILAGMGHKVSGSDIAPSGITRRLRRQGITVDIGHKASLVKKQDLVVYSSSIRPDNPEILTAKRKKIRVIARIELLKTLMEKYEKSVAVTGTHGKTTITAMSSLLMEMTGFDPAVLIGGESPHFGGNAKLGKGRVLVAEVDESDGRFVILKPTHIIISNLEKEHTEHYKSKAHLVVTFRKFLARQSQDCSLFYFAEDRALKDLAVACKGKSISFGFSKKADVRASGIKIQAFKTNFDCFKRRKRIGRFTINIPGVHNVLNALAVISLGLEFGIKVERLKETLAAYKGAKRRFEIIGEAGGAKIVEDYAHHPTEIKATIAAAFSLKPKRLIAVFQPHRYTRTRSFRKEFAKSFAGADEVILTEVYSASEDRIKGASAKSIYDLMVKDKSPSVKLMEKSRITGYLCGRIRKGDLVLVLGAGDIGKTAREIFKKMST